MAAELKPKLTFDEYLEIESKAEFKSEFIVEHFVRQTINQWLFTEFHDLQDTIHLPSINCHLTLSDVYDKVKWPEAE